ncbi:hypothetical protein AC1031_003563 [Aphanomyces cochlioides]|nr:hypothetical protein AC1031_003563 [Aphanomyces cochlioides]
MMYLHAKYILDFNPDDKKQCTSTLRAVQRFLKVQGYKRGTRSKGSTYHLSASNALARDTYVRLMQPHIKGAGRPHIAYTDESFIHHHCKSHHQDLYDPSDKLDVAPKEKHKGRRYCFVAAILDSPTLESRVMALNIFTGGERKTTGKCKETKDYHGMFDQVYYKSWFKRLLDELDTHGVQNALIVLDNAKYHKGLPSSTPTSGKRKSVLLEACALYGIATSGDEYKMIVDMAQSLGHTVVYTPPHHSDLQPIELIWANVKTKVGRQYTDMTQFPEVKTRLELAFAELKPNTINGCVRSAEENLQKLHEHLIEIDNLESDEDSSAESSSNDDTGSE